MPGSRLGPLPAISHLIISITLGAKFCCLHLTEETLKLTEVRSIARGQPVSK